MSPNDRLKFGLDSSRDAFEISSDSGTSLKMREKKKRSSFGYLIERFGEYQCAAVKESNVYRFAANSPDILYVQTGCVDGQKRAAVWRHSRGDFMMRVHHSCIGCEEGELVKGFGLRVSGYVRLLVLGVGEDALGLESSPGFLKSPCLDARRYGSASPRCSRQRRDKPGVGLVCVADDAKGQTAKETPVEDRLPALLLVLLAGLDTEEDTARGVVVVVV
jgi:hypothetical protein